MKTHVFSQNRTLFALIFSLGFVGCSVTPEYVRPDLNLPNNFKNQPIQSPSMKDTTELWKLAQPSDQQDRGQWWLIFQDPTLNDLQQHALTKNQDVALAIARLEQARALTGISKAGSSPNISVNSTAERERISDNVEGSTPGTRNFFGINTSLSYEPDLFGRVKTHIERSQATVEEHEALLQHVRLALTADIAESYLKIRGLDAEIQIFQQHLALQLKNLTFLQARYKYGDISRLDLNQSQVQIENLKSDMLELKKMRVHEEHRLAILLAKTPAEFSLKSRSFNMPKLDIPVGFPSSLLERRPDIAAAERKMAIANADVGLAKAAFYPSFQLGLNAGTEATRLSDILNWSSRTFLLGPIGGTILSLPIFDGGQRSSRLEQQRWIYEEQVASYKKAVLNAFQETENVMSDLTIIRQQMQHQQAALGQHEQSHRILQQQYKAGEIAYMQVLYTERDLLLNQRTLMQLQASQAISTVKLIKALGGIW